MAEASLPRHLHAIGVAATAEARLRGASTVQAEHVLLALLSDPESPVSRRVAVGGLDRRSLQAALAAERAASLAVVGIGSLDPALLDAVARPTPPPWGASVRELLRAADKPAAKRARPASMERELAAAALRADLGTLPRALALAGIDRATLLDALRDRA